MTTSVVSDTDLEVLLSLLVELHEAGRTEEAASISRVYSALQASILAELEADLDDDDPEFVRHMEEAERDIAEGRLIPHEDVMRRLLAPNDA